MTDEVPSRWRVRRILAWGSAAALLLVVLAAYLTAIWFVWPTSNIPERADAAVVYAGGRGERLDVGMSLLQDGIVDTLVINSGIDFDSRAGVWVAETCADPPEHLDIRCIVATPDSTQGEGATFARYAEEMGWDSVIAVSTDHHLKRAELWLDRCYNGKVYRAVGDAPTSFKQVRHEWAAMIASYTFDRSCPAPGAGP